MAKFGAGKPARSDASAPVDAAVREALRSRSDQIVDLRRIAYRLRRLTRLDSSVFPEVAADKTQTLSAVVVAVTAVLLSALGGWLWLIVDADGLSTGRIAVREFLLGSLFALALWVGWVLVAHMMLESVFGRHAERGRLFRAMGYATLPAAGALLMVIPAVAFALGLLSMMAWFAMSSAAIESAVPEATRKEVLVANVAGFSLFTVILSLLANAAGLAPGFFAHAADLSSYV